MSFLSRKALTTSMSALSAVAGAAIYYGTNNARTRDTLPSYEATFSVPLKCDSCVNDIKSALSKVDGPSHGPFSSINVSSTPSIPRPKLFRSQTTNLQPPRYLLNLLLHPLPPRNRNLHLPTLNPNLHHPIHRPRRHPPRLRQPRLRRRMHPRNPSFLFHPPLRTSSPPIRINTNIVLSTTTDNQHIKIRLPRPRSRAPDPTVRATDAAGPNAYILAQREIQC